MIRTFFGRCGGSLVYSASDFQGRGTQVEVYHRMDRKSLDTVPLNVNDIAVVLTGSFRIDYFRSWF